MAKTNLLLDLTEFFQVDFLFVELLVTLKLKILDF